MTDNVRLTESATDGVPAGGSEQRRRDVETIPCEPGYQFLGFAALMNGLLSALNGSGISPSGRNDVRIGCISDHKTLSENKYRYCRHILSFKRAVHTGKYADHLREWTQIPSKIGLSASQVRGMHMAETFGAASFTLLCSRSSAVSYFRAHTLRFHQSSTGLRN